MYKFKTIIFTCIYKLKLNLYTNLVSNCKGGDWIILKN